MSSDSYGKASIIEGLQFLKLSRASPKLPSAHHGLSFLLDAWSMIIFAAPVGGWRRLKHFTPTHHVRLDSFWLPRRSGIVVGHFRISLSSLKLFRVKSLRASQPQLSSQSVNPPPIIIIRLFVVRYLSQAPPMYLHHTYLSPSNQATLMDCFKRIYE